MRQVILELPSLLDAVEIPGTGNPIQGLDLPYLCLFLSKAERLNQLKPEPSPLVWSLASPELEGAINPRWSAQYLNLDGANDDTFCWYRADPMELQPDRIAVYLTGNRHLSLSPKEKQVLEQGLNGIGDSLGAHFVVISAQEGYIRVDNGQGEAPCEVEFIPAIKALGKDQLATFPRGKDSIFWKQLLTELQMYLHGSPVNTQHIKKGMALINSIYFWGSNHAPLPQIQLDVLYSNSSLIKSCGFKNAIETENLPDSWSMKYASENNSQFVDMELIWLRKQGLVSTWQQQIIHYEKYWFSPLIQALKKHQIDRVSLVLSTDAVYTLTASDLKKFWKRKKTISELLSITQNKNQHNSQSNSQSKIKK